MSQPPHDYAQYTGQRTQQPDQPASVPHNQTAPSIYPSSMRPMPAAVAGNYFYTNGSFEYAGNRIPGLGMSTASATPLPPSPYRAELSSSMAIPVYVPSYEGYSGPAAPLNPNEQDRISLEHGHGRKTQSAPTHQKPAPLDEASEEGELSEGEFEDLYEPKALSGLLQDRLKQQTRPVLANGEGTGSAGDADGSSVYDTGSTQGEMMIDSTSVSQLVADEEDDYEPGEYQPEYQLRDKSRSYSPHLSPKEAQHAESTTDRGDPKMRESTHLPQSRQPFVQQDIASKQVANAAVATNGHVSSTPDDSAQSASATSLPLKSVSDAKKKAQEAILGLWPLKVRYQNYLEEGLDPQVVKSLFTELGLDASLPKPTVVIRDPPLDPSPIQIEDQPQAQSSPKPTSQPPSTLPNPPKPVTNMGAAGNVAKLETKRSAQEERKDKIARMLAEKKKKNACQPAPTITPLATSVPPVAAAAAPSTTSETTDPAKIKLRAQNNQKLLEKLAALKKQQGTKPDPTQQNAVTPILVSNEKPINTTSDVSDAEQPVPVGASIGGIGEPDASSTPGVRLELSVSSSPHSPPKPRSMKRPIASDFDGGSANGSTLKRTRTQETLIIDISDDEDVEMDLGSPTDPPSRAIQNNALPRQNSLAAFPPLSHSRNWRGQKSLPATPAAGTPSEHGYKLDSLTQKIQEAKRMIAEAEAKKVANKRPSGVSTPLAQSPAPTPAPLGSLRLPKTSERPLAVETERRARIASYHIPVLDATLKEKQEKLQRLQEEAAQLAIEVQATLDERLRLTGEMESLDAVELVGSELNGQLEAMVSAANDSNIEGELNLLDASNADSEHAVVTEHLTESLPESTNDMDLEFDSHASKEVPDAELITAPAIALQSNRGSPAALDVDVRLIAAPVPENVVSFRSDAIVEDEIALSNQHVEMSNGDGDGDDQLPTDADVPMQISDAEDDGSYEPMPARISAADKAHITDGEDGEVKSPPQIEISLLIPRQVPDGEPYEPNPAQVSKPVTQTELDAVTAEVQDCSPQEARLLTTGQARPSDDLSADALLSYQSPLRYFHAYKFHPKFLENVSGGLKSMTYSSKIDVSRPICPSLIDGGQCPNGSGCDFQHFDKMVLSDSAIIAELGSTDMYTGERKDRFIDGLKKVLSDLKTNKLKDFDSISKALVQYRIDFLGDKSKILSLNDVVI